jgi:hypothetical protein
MTAILILQPVLKCNRSTIDQIFCIRQILEKKWEYNDIEFGVPMKLIRLIKMFLN